MSTNELVEKLLEETPANSGVALDAVIDAVRRKQPQRQGETDEEWDTRLDHIIRNVVLRAGQEAVSRDDFLMQLRLVAPSRIGVPGDTLALALNL